MSTSNKESSFEAWSQGDCQYFCTLCKETFKCSLSFWHHVTTVHKLSIPGYTKINPTFCVKKSTIICQMCFTMVTYDAGKLRVHFIKKHEGVTLREYYEKHVMVGGGNSEADNSSNVSTTNDNSSNVNTTNDNSNNVSTTNDNSNNATATDDSGVAVEEIAQEPREKRQRIGEKRVKIEVPEKEQDAKPWYDGCEYQCHFCPLATKTASAIGIHLKNYHKKTELAKGEGFTASESGHDCKLCSITLFRNLSSIKMHLSRAHGITLQEYEERRNEPKEKKKSVPEVPPKNIMWYDRCRFRCGECKIISWSRATIERHVTKCPWLYNKKDKAGKALKAEIETALMSVYRCKICNFGVQHAAGYIAPHVKAHHGLSLADYSAKYECGK